MRGSGKEPPSYAAQLPTPIGPIRATRCSAATQTPYQRTAHRITSAGKRKPRNVRAALVMDGILGGWWRETALTGVRRPAQRNRSRHAVRHLVAASGQARRPRRRAEKVSHDPPALERARSGDLRDAAQPSTPP